MSFGEFFRPFTRVLSDNLWFAPAGLRFRGSLYRQRGQSGPSMGLPELKETRVGDTLVFVLLLPRVKGSSKLVI